jgi:hypothetical protein
VVRLSPKHGGHLMEILAVLPFVILTAWVVIDYNNKNKGE